MRANYGDGNAPGYYEALNAKGSPCWLRAIISILAVYLLPAILLLYFVRMNSGMAGSDDMKNCSCGSVPITKSKGRTIT